MNWLVENWYLIVGLIAVLVVIVAMIVNFCNKPTEEQIKNIKKWLEWAVTEAEKELKSGTGQLKLRKVYAMACAQFEFIPYVFSFDEFSAWVDEALEWLEKQLETNPQLAEYVKGE